MLPTIGHIIFHRDLVDISAELCKEFINEVAKIEVIMPPSLDNAQILAEAENLAKISDIIITRADTVDLIRPFIKTPVIARSASFSDILNTLISARKINRRMALVLHNTQDFDFGSWPETLGIEIKKFIYYSFYDIQQVMAKVLEDNFNLVVGGTLAGLHATNSGMNHRLVAATKDTVVHSIHKAIDVWKALKKEREYIANFQSLLDFTHEGVIFLEDTDLMTHLNTRACQLLRVNKQDLLKSRFLEIADNLLSEESLSMISEVLESNHLESYLGLLLTLKNGDTLVANVNYASFEDANTRTIITFNKALDIQKAENKVRQKLSGKGFKAKFSINDIVGQSRALEETKEKARAYAKTESTILIYGETGTGKELFAHSIHRLSSRKNGPFVAVNSCALPKELMESELFGYEEGAFTGAKKAGKPGLLEIAHGGTLFIDEIGTMPLDLQAKLLRVIQEKEFVRLGGTNVIPINLRVMAASNRNLEHAVRDGDFRQDLYYRLNVLLLSIPPLRHRPEDIRLLFKHLVQKIALNMNVQVKNLEPEGLTELCTHSWPGNIRELENFAERYVAMTAYGQFHSNVLKQLLHETKGDFAHDLTNPQNLQANLFEASLMNEREILLNAGTKVDWNRQKMARELGVSLTTLWRKLKRSGLLNPTFNEHL